MNGALIFFILCGVLAAIVGAFLPHTFLLHVGLIVAVALYLVLLARHINPEGTDHE